MPVATTEPESCPLCDGGGVIWNPELHANDPANGEACPCCEAVDALVEDEGEEVAA